MTPAHSPRLRPHNQLPGIRNLSLHHIPAPALEPLEPSNTDPQLLQQQQQYSISRNNSGPRISDIFGKVDGTQRKLPVPNAPQSAMQDLPTLLNSDGDLLMNLHSWDGQHN